MKVDLIKSYDWEALYIDGIKVIENHSLRTEDILVALKIDYKRTWFHEDELEKLGKLPKDLNELKEKIKK